MKGKPCKQPRGHVHSSLYCWDLIMHPNSMTVDLNVYPYYSYVDFEK